jgi:hypothetical protein
MTRIPPGPKWVAGRLQGMQGKLASMWYVSEQKWDTCA